MTSASHHIPYTNSLTPPEQVLRYSRVQKFADGRTDIQTDRQTCSNVVVVAVASRLTPHPSLLSSPHPPTHSLPYLKTSLAIYNKVVSQVLNSAVSCPISHNLIDASSLRNENNSSIHLLWLTHPLTRSSTPYSMIKTIQFPNQPS